ncbi:bifunctional sugar-1-phosphate nucleotidylyltransferase/acetyltransferase [Chloroflexota bacterium]
MKAIILAAGEGSRMHPLTYTRPKVMLPLANLPILEHLLTQVKGAGIEEFVFIVGYHDEQVRAYFGSGDKWGVSIGYATQRKQLGTANALEMVKDLAGEKFLMINGDIVVGQPDISRLAKQQETTLAIFEVEDTAGLGVAEVSEGRVTRIHEKMPNPPSRLANTGLYLFTRDIFDAIAQTPQSPRGEYEITDSLQLQIDRGRPVHYQELDYWLDLSYPWDLLSANETRLQAMVAEQSGLIEENAAVKGAVSIGQNTVVRSGSYIVGPVIIGQDCDIGPNCYIRPGTAIGDNCHIGAATEVKNSIIMKGTKIPHHNYVGDSVIGEGVNLGAGTKIANLKLDGTNIVVAGVDTGRRKLGAIIGDGVETGINASINVGTIIGNDACIGPRALAHGVISPRSKIF